MAVPLLWGCILVFGVRAGAGEWMQGEPFLQDLHQVVQCLEGRMAVGSFLTP